VARAAHVCVDASVSAVGAPAHLWRSVDLDVFYHQVVRVQALELCVALCVLEHLEQELSALLGPATLGRAPVLRLRAAAHAAGEAPEGHALLVRDDVLEEGDRAAQVHLLDVLRRLTRVLEVDSQVGSTSLRRLGGILGVGGIASHPEASSLDRSTKLNI